jgi:hypothetical protein
MSARMQKWLPKNVPIKRLLAASGSHTNLIPPKPEELSWRDYALMLLHIGAELEHCLMVQYLYAAYSLGGPQVPEAKREMITRWQETILSIAKEEMGHFLTVQNVLTLIGGPLAFQREDFPWDSDFYPFPFKFEPLTLEALAKYVYAEAPMDFSGEMANKISGLLAIPLKQEATQDQSYHHVAELYNRLLQILSNPEIFPDENFHEWRYQSQGSFAEWARNHGKAEGDEANDWNLDPPAPKDQTPPGRVDMIIEQMATRTEVIDALKRVAEQGEGTQVAGERSHFQRFFDIFVEYLEYQAKESAPAYRHVPINPTTLDIDGTRITFPTSRKLAALFDLRYRSLMICVGFSLRMGSKAHARANAGARASLLQHSFVEMYNLKALANLLTRAPLRDNDDSARAGPPFQIPYTLEISDRFSDAWRSLLDISDASLQLLSDLGAGDAWVSADFIESMKNADHSWRAAIHVYLQAEPRP